MAPCVNGKRASRRKGGVDLSTEDTSVVIVDIDRGSPAFSGGLHV